MAFENYAETEGIKNEESNTIPSQETIGKELEEYRSKLVEGDIFGTLAIKESLEKNNNFDKELFKSEEIKTAVEYGFITCLEKGDFPSAIVLINSFPEKKEFFNKKTKEESQLFLEEKNYEMLSEMQKANILDQNILQDTHFKELQTEQFNKFLAGEDIYGLIEMKKIGFFTEEMENNEQFNELLESKFDTLLQEQEEELGTAQNIRETFPSKKEEFEVIIANQFKKSLSHNDFSKLIESKEKFTFDLEKLNNEERSQLNGLIEKEFRSVLEKNIDILKAIKIKNAFPENREALNEIALEEFTRSYEEKDIERLSIIKANFEINSPLLESDEFNQFIKEQYTSSLQENDVVLAALIEESFPEKSKILGAAKEEKK
ncbi:MAG: hypothetical protein WCX74_02745 [Candidatus Paceibacterota bacterium]